MKLLRLYYLKLLLIRLKYHYKYGNQLTINGCTFGKRVLIKIKNNGSVRLNPHVRLEDNTRIISSGGKIKIGEKTYINAFCKIDSHYSIEIGENCLLGPNVSVYDNNHCFSDQTIPIILQGFDVQPVTIGSNVWLGTNVVVTAGVTIGDRVVVGANSVITKDLPSNGLYGGIPAKLIKSI